MYRAAIVVSLAHTEKHRCSPKEEIDIKVVVVVHPRTVSGLFENVSCKTDLDDTDETQFVLSIDNSRNL